MDIYKIQLSIKAKNDFKLIINYIRDTLLEPQIAIRYNKLIQNEIEKLKYYPKKFPVVDADIIKCNNMRKISIKNYIIFYIVDDKNKIVNIDRILGGNMNWINII